MDGLGLVALNGKNSSEVFVNGFFGIFRTLNVCVGSYSMLEVGSVWRFWFGLLAWRNVMYLSFWILMLLSMLAMVDAMSLFRSWCTFVFLWVQENRFDELAADVCVRYMFAVALVQGLVLLFAGFSFRSFRALFSLQSPSVRS